MARNDLVPSGSAGDREALVEFMNRLRPLMLRTARRRLRRHAVLKGRYDDEDAVQGALDGLWEDVESGKPLRRGKRGGLWGLFSRALTHWIWAASRHEAAQIRGGSGISPASGALEPAGAAPSSIVNAVSPDDLDHCESRAPPPEIAAMQAEVVQQLLCLLDSEQQEVVRLRVERLSIAEIASSLGLSDRISEATGLRDCEPGFRAHRIVLYI